jgi:hypothetical protein
MRSIPGSPAPRSIRVGKGSARSFTPVAAAIRAAATRPGSRRARPPRSSAQSPLARSAAATSPTASSGTGAACGGAGGGAGAAPSDHDTSAGRISVATWPGGPHAAAIASVASEASVSVLSEVRTQLDTLSATVSMSDWSWASWRRW